MNGRDRDREGGGRARERDREGGRERERGGRERERGVEREMVSGKERKTILRLIFLLL